jgi:dTDP-4-amino-4,6-dideoxygalactose transaminase
MPLPNVIERHSHHLFVVTFSERDELQAHMRDSGVESLINYPIPIHHQHALGQLACDSTGLMRSEEHAVRCVSLPCHPMLSELNVLKIVDCLNKFDIKS